MTRVDGISNSNVADDGKVPETNQQSTQPPSSEHVFAAQQPQDQGITSMHTTPQIVIQPQFFIQPPAVVYAPPPQLPPQPPPLPPFQPHINPPQPPQQPLPNQQGWTTGLPIQQGWTTGLFDCIDDPENAIITLCCPCVTFGQLASTIDNRGTSCEMSGMIYTVVALVIGMPCIISCTYRTKLRGRFGLMETPASDCITHLCCEYCALCQEYRELNNRGFNPSAGKSIAKIKPF
ncbi:hypothetical protein LXL04_011455 [Taraxacum kok-saghyz]